ncbi:MAG: hypothetical protein GEV12_05640 [Micromonosporaceae bacterium]|nr:hypothetical protein [Micromonosporaceae bacterium]
MSRQLTCPACGETDELTGRPGPDGIQITCDTCGADWLRDAAPATCASCGETELVHRPQATTAYSRGTQVSIVGWRQLPLCVTCDAPMLSRSLAGKPIPNGYRPAAMTRHDPGEPPADEITILPR